MDVQNLSFQAKERAVRETEKLRGQFDVAFDGRGEIAD